jgi:pteridine reductase
MVKKESKVALITGAACRIGAEIAQFLNKMGMSVIVHYHQSEVEAHNMVEQACMQRADSMRCVAADLRDLEQVRNLAEQALSCWGRVDLLVNNAACFYPTVLEHVENTVWNDIFDSNVKAPFFLSQALIPALKHAKGNIINITDIHAKTPLKNHSVYCMSKAALHMMTQSLARDLAPDIRVNAIAPGVTLWPNQKNNILSELAQQQLLAQIPLNCMGKPQQIAETVFYIVEHAQYMTGEVITLDGGRHLKN